MKAVASASKILHQQAHELEQELRQAALDLGQQLKLVQLIGEFSRSPNTELARARTAALEALTIFAAGYADTWAQLNEAVGAAEED